MSEFSECLSYFIKEGKTDTALLEERTGVPCSVIASFLKGKELPEQSVFRICCVNYHSQWKKSAFCRIVIMSAVWANGPIGDVPICSSSSQRWFR